MISLIGEEGEINGELVGFPSAPLTVSIFGTQASGKSTILNHAFGTQFPVLDTLKSRGRCTKGVWFHNTPARLVIDTEGFDSYERTEDDKIFEKQLSLFCVALSEVVLVNVLMYEVGRFAGGHLDVLDAIFKVGERLVTPLKKRIVFLVRDCTPDADRALLKHSLDHQVNKLLKRYDNKQLKCTLDYYFMSHYIYDPEAFAEEAAGLAAFLTLKHTSAFNNYQDAERLLYIQQLWKKIRSFETEIDLKSIDDALKVHVFERLKSEALLKLEAELAHYTTLNDVKSYDRYVESLKKVALEHYSEHRPKHIKLEEVEAFSSKLFEVFEPTAVKHFNEVAIRNIEAELEAQLSSEIERNKNSKRLSSTTFKKKKELIDLYKRVVTNHKEYSLLLKHFNERISEILAKEERKFTHLFSMFEITAEKELNREVDRQVASLLFKPDLVAQRIKALCQEYQYNEWEVNFKDIWERVTFRCIEKVIPQLIEHKSASANADAWLLSADQTTNIIAYHTRLEKKAIAFCRDILEYLHEDTAFSQPLSRVKDEVRENLAKRLLEENKRFKVSLLLVSLLLLLLYGEMETMLGWFMRKKSRRLILHVYWYGALLLAGGSLYQKYRATLPAPETASEKSAE